MARRSSLRTPVKVEPARFLSIDEPTVCQDYERIVQKLNKQAEKHIRKRLDAERIDTRRKKTTVSTRVNLINDGLYAIAIQTLITRGRTQRNNQWKWKADAHEP